MTMWHIIEITFVIVLAVGVLLLWKEARKKRKELDGLCGVNEGSEKEISEQIMK